VPSRRSVQSDLAGIRAVSAMMRPPPNKDKRARAVVDVPELAARRAAAPAPVRCEDRRAPLDSMDIIFFFASWCPAGLPRCNENRLHTSLAGHRRFASRPQCGRASPKQAERATVLGIRSTR